MAREPIFNAPGGVVAVLIVLVGVHGLLESLPFEQGDWLRWEMAFNPARYRAHEIGNWGAGSGRDPTPFHDLAGAPVWSFITHQVLHGDWTHLALNCAWLLAFGGAIARRVGTMRFLWLSVTAGLAGALAYLAVRFGENAPMVGASGAISGLMGGTFRFLFSALDRGSLDQFRTEPAGIPRKSIASSLRDRRVQMAVGLYLILNLIMAVAAPVFTDQGGIAWEAHLGGFAFGFLAFAAFDTAARET